MGAMGDLDTGIRFDEDHETPGNLPAISERECLLQIRSGLIVALAGINRRLGFTQRQAAREE